MSDPDANLKRVREFWDALYVHDFAAVGSFIAADGLYEDVPAPDAGAVGPENVVKRLRIGFEGVDKHEHELVRMVAQGDTVVTEHRETWCWPGGERVTLPFVTIHVLRDDQIVLWRDYWDLNTLMSGAPAAWLQRLARAGPEDFGSRARS